MSEDCMPFEMTPALWEPSPSQVRQTRAWLAATPGADDEAAVAEVCRRWPALAAWEAEWVVEEARQVVAPAPPPKPAPLTEADPLPRLEPAPLPEGVTTKMSRARREKVARQKREPAPPKPPREPRAPRPPKPPAVRPPCPHMATAVAEPIAGVPQWEGYPVRAGRIPRHLCPEPLVTHRLSNVARMVLWALAGARRRGEPVLRERLHELSGHACREPVEQAIAHLRKAKLMRGPLVTDWSHEHKTARKGCPPVRYDGMVTALGMEVAAQMPRHMLACDSRTSKQDRSDMIVLEAIRVWHTRGAGLSEEGRAERWMSKTELQRLPGCTTCSAALARLQAAGVVVERYHKRQLWYRLAPEVARAWGVGC